MKKKENRCRRLTFFIEGTMMAPQVTETGSFSLTTTTGNQTLVSEFFDL
jgi:hypothetical protein